MTHPRAFRFLPQTLTSRGTDTPDCAFGFFRTLMCLRPIGSSSLSNDSPELEDAPPLVSKRGLLRSDGAIFRLSPPGFFFHESQVTSHKSRTLVARV